MFDECVSFYECVPRDALYPSVADAVDYAESCIHTVVRCAAVCIYLYISVVLVLTVNNHRMCRLPVM